MVLVDRRAGEGFARHGRDLAGIGGELAHPGLKLLPCTLRLPWFGSRLALDPLSGAFFLLPNRCTLAGGRIPAIYTRGSNVVVMVSPVCTVYSFLVGSGKRSPGRYFQCPWATGIKTPGPSKCANWFPSIAAWIMTGREWAPRAGRNSAPGVVEDESRLHTDKRHRTIHRRNGPGVSPRQVHHHGPLSASGTIRNRHRLFARDGEFQRGRGLHLTAVERPAANRRRRTEFSPSLAGSHAEVAQ